MLFNSLSFLIFFPVVVGIYFIIPRKVRWVWLLIASYYYYMSWNAKYALLLAASTGITWLSGLLIDRFNNDHPNSGRNKKLVVAASFLCNLAILFIFKYLNFITGTIHAWFPGSRSLFPETSIVPSPGKARDRSEAVMVCSPLATVTVIVMVAAL